MKIQKGILQISTSNMREILTLNSVSFSRNANFEMSATSIPLKTIFANVQEQQGSRILELSAVVFKKVFKVYCRYDNDININDTLNYKGMLLKIHSLNNLSQLNRYYEILCYTDV